VLPSRPGHAEFLGLMLASASMSELPWSEGPVILAISVRRAASAFGMATLDSRAEAESAFVMATLDSRAEAESDFGMATLDSSAETAFGMATLGSRAAEAFMATLDSRAAAAFMQAWPLVADWIAFHREAISDEYFRAREESLMEACFQAWWYEAFMASPSEMDDVSDEISSEQFEEPEGVRIDHWYDWLRNLGDQSRRAHDVCVCKLNQACSHICASLGASSYMRHSRPVVKLIVILLRAKSWEPL
jgi:hypothetical protein